MADGIFGPSQESGSPFSSPLASGWPPESTWEWWLPCLLGVPEVCPPRLPEGRVKVVLHIDENEDLPWHRLTASLRRALPEPLLAQGYNLSCQVTPCPAQPSPALLSCSHVRSPGTGTTPGWARLPWPPCALCPTYPHTWAFCSEPTGPSFALSRSSGVPSNSTWDGRSGMTVRSLLPLSCLGGVSTPPPQSSQAGRDPCVLSPQMFTADSWC